MAATVFVLDVIVTLILSGCLLYSYGNWLRHRIAVTLAVLIAWYFSFLIIFILPLDVSSTAYKQCIAGDNVTYGSTTVTPPYPQSTYLPPYNGTQPTNVITAADINQTRYEDESIAESVARNVMERTGQAGGGSASTLDVSTGCDPPYTLLEDGVLLDMWKIVYWSSQVSCLYPFEILILVIGLA